MQRELSLAFARVLLATAWADDDLAADEVASLRTSLRQLPAILGLPTINDAEWQQLEPWLQRPVSAERRAAWLAELRDLIEDEAQLNLIIAGIDRLMRADRVLTPAERQVAEEIRAALADLQVGGIAGIVRAVRRAVAAWAAHRVRDTDRSQEQR